MTHTVLITGTSSGFGLASARLFLARGWNVIATMRSPDPTLFESSPRLLVTALDVTAPHTVAEAVTKGIARFGQIDVLVNNAGVGLFGAAEATPAELTRQVFETNTFGVMAVARAVIPHMRERGSGTIVNVTSSVGIAPMPLVAVYTASKYAIEGYSEALAHELGAFGVRVKIVQPGFAPTTSFSAKSGGRREDLLPTAYGAFASRYLASMQNYPTAYTAEADVAEATYAAATSSDDKLRYPAGADSVMLAQLRESLSEPEFMGRMRTMTGG
ncbi:SDR family oxidoreductase [Peristeroidobacter soli]|uniref:SDR family oxidoreductase n=1 Tax=Peristeroidobacter soli TaxID=2497877 RepID=UPI00101D1B1E|nr:SDR family oxidoreductase [Peristeroidobacter soli]